MNEPHYSNNNFNKDINIKLRTSLTELSNIVTLFGTELLTQEQQYYINKIKNINEDLLTFSNAILYSNNSEKKHEILIIEDNNLTLSAHLEYIRDSSYKITAVKNGRDALKKLDQQFDLILTDIRLGDIDGEELVKRIKSTTTNKDTIVVAITTLGEEYCKRFLEIGFDDYYVKPLTQEAFKQIFRRWL